MTKTPMTTPFDTNTQSKTLEEATEILRAVALERRHARGCITGNNYAWDPVRGECVCYVVPAMLFVGAKRKETGDA